MSRWMTHCRGRAPATHITEPVWLEMGEHREVLRFIILGLSWLGKWGPKIWWEVGYRKLKIGVGLPLTSRHRGGQRVG